QRPSLFFRRPTTVAAVSPGARAPAATPSLASRADSPATPASAAAAAAAAAAGVAPSPSASASPGGARAAVPAGAVTRFAQPVSPAEPPPPQPPRSRRRSLSYANTIAALRLTPTADEVEAAAIAEVPLPPSFEDWAGLVGEEHAAAKAAKAGSGVRGGISPSGMAAVAEEDGPGEEDFDTVRPFGRAAVSAAGSPPTLPGPQIEGATPSPPSPQPPPPVTYDAVLFATDNDYLESARVRAFFRSHALCKEDNVLFEMPEYTQEDEDRRLGRLPALDDPSPRATRAGMADLEVCCCGGAASEVRSSSKALRLLFRARCCVAAVILVACLFLL
ncbi:hypothetical protein HK405_000908, partial [Cladochytrium tenue]